MIAKIIRNSSYLLFAQAVAKMAAFLYTIFLLRSLADVNNYGIYAAATAYFSIFSLVSDLGINRYIAREIAKNPACRRELFARALTVRTVILVVLVGLFSTLTLILDPLEIRAELTVLAVLAVLPQAVSLTIDSVLVAMERLDLSALGIVVLSLSNVIAGVILVSLGFDVFGAVFAIIFSQLLYALTIFFLAKKIGIGHLTLSGFSNLRDLLAESLPYGFLAVLGLLYFRVDTLILSYLKGTYDTGIYGAAYKFLDAIVFVPSAISSTLFPVFARLGQGQSKSLYRLYKKSLLANLGLSAVVAAAYFTLLPVIISLYLPKFTAAIEVIKILTLTIPFMFMISPQSLVLLTQKKFLKPLTVISVFNLGLNVLLNLIFIPKYSYLAAAWITVLSDVIGFLIFFVFIRRNFSAQTI